MINDAWKSADYRAEHFLWSVADRVATVTLNRPERKNPLTFESYAELRDLFRRLTGLSSDFFGRRHAHLSVIATSAAAEGKGVGRALMQFADDWARDRELPFITLNVFAANARARRLYEKSGYSVELLKYGKRL